MFLAVGKSGEETKDSQALEIILFLLQFLSSSRSQSFMVLKKLQGFDCFGSMDQWIHLSGYITHKTP